MKLSPAERLGIAEEALHRLEILIDELRALSCLVELARIAEIERADMCGYDRQVHDQVIQRRIFFLANQCDDVFCDQTEKLLELEQRK